MYELLRVLRLIPVQIRWLGTFFIMLPLIFFISRSLGLSSRIAAFFVIGLLVLFLLWWAIGGLRKVGDKKRSKDFEAGLGASREGPVSKEEIREAVKELSERWAISMKELKDGGLSIYDMPWFLLIGEPQSGKSTTLMNSGLEFPVGQEALSGAGGTRNCDWWFTNESVILDTAGRFTFQEQNAPDRHEWSAFLDLLRKHRKECPINGALVVIPATSLVEDTLEEQEAKASNIRKKLLNLQKSLEIRFPIFILITKCDRILGFTEFFSRLEPGEEQQQILGWSNSEEYDRAWDPKSFHGIFDGLLQRIQKIRLRFLREVNETDQADRMFVFPEELDALREPLYRYFYNIFSASRFEEPFMFRGFYLTSGLQQGRPIALACRDLLRVQVGDPQGVLEDLESIFLNSRAFFIHDLYEKKVFPEQGLVKRTRAALKKQLVYKRVFWGLIGVGVLTSFFLLLPALLNLARLLGPINKLTGQAKTCLTREEPCDVGESYALIHKIEQKKRDLQKSKWTMRFLMRGGSRNEITEKLLPTVQAGLLHRGVLESLLASFEARSTPEMWAESGVDYPTFYEAFQQFLRFRAYSRALETEKRAEIREGVSLVPLLRFMRSRIGYDDSPIGKDIDTWLTGDSPAADIDQVEEVFQHALTADQDFDLMAFDKILAPINAHAAFDEYWTVRRLAGWNVTLIQTYFKTYATLYDEVLNLDPVIAGAEPTLAAYGDITGRFNANWTEGETYMKRGTDRDSEHPDPYEDEGKTGTKQGTGAAEKDGRDPYEDDEPPVQGAQQGARQAAAAIISSERPGRGVKAWEKNCREDYEGLRKIYARLTAKKDIDEHCTQKIPVDWRQLMNDREAYQHLYEELDNGRLAWSTGAATLRAPLIQMAELVSRDEYQRQGQRFKDSLTGQGGDQQRLELISRFCEDRERTLGEPLGLIAEFESSRPPGAFHAVRGREKLQEIRALALGLEVLPTARDYFAGEVFPVNCDSCFVVSHAKAHVPPANQLLDWSRGVLSPALSVTEIQQPFQEIDDAVFKFMEEFVSREKLGGGGGGGFVRPRAASRAKEWITFTRALRKWRIVSTGGSAPTRSSGGLDINILEDLARNNDRLKPLVDDFRSRTRRPSRTVEVSEDLKQAAQTYKRNIEVLEDNPLAAWKQLAQGADGASLADFHVFSANRRLRDNTQAEWMKTEVEALGAKLLSDEIRPLYEDQARIFWQRQQDCCQDRFPFITENALRRHRDQYDRGYAHDFADPDDIWLRELRDGSRHVVTNPILLETVTREDIDRLFFEGGSLDKLFLDFALGPIVDPENGAQTTVDFVGDHKGRLRVMRQWQRFLYGDAGDRDWKAVDSGRSFDIRMLERTSRDNHIYLGERIGQIDFFGPYPLRPSTDAGRRRTLTVPLKLDDVPLLLSGFNESDRGGWLGRLELQGGPLKIFFFTLLSSDGKPLEEGRVWTIRVEIPNYPNPNERLEGVFELRFDRPVPGVFPN